MRWRTVNGRTRVTGSSFAFRAKHSAREGLASWARARRMGPRASGQPLDKAVHRCRSSLHTRRCQGPRRLSPEVRSRTPGVRDGNRDVHDRGVGAPGQFASWPRDAVKGPSGRCHVSGASSADSPANVLLCVETSSRPALNQPAVRSARYFDSNPRPESGGLQEQTGPIRHAQDKAGLTATKNGLRQTCVLWALKQPVGVLQHIPRRAAHCWRGPFRLPVHLKRKLQKHPKERP